MKLIAQKRSRDFIKQLEKYSFISFNIPLKRYSTMRVGGSALALAEPENVEQLIDVYRFAQENDIPVRILGAGSSIIPSDQGFCGLIICTRKTSPTPKRLSNELIEVSSGAFMPSLVAHCKRWRLGGLEWSIGIPGTIGGCVWMNAGAWGGDISKTLVSVTYWDGENLCKADSNDISWGYRYSSFQDHPDWLIVKAQFLLQSSTVELIDQNIKKILKNIKETQPRSKPNVGTVFKDNRGALPKLAAGLQIGSIVCPKENPGWLINIGKGTSKDVYRIIKIILWRHLLRGLPLPKIEPLFLPYNPDDLSYTIQINHPPRYIRLIARISNKWSFLFKRNLKSWRPSMTEGVVLFEN